MLADVADASVLTAPPIASSSELADRLSAIQAVLPPGDGLAWFNRMYLLVTESVRDNLGQQAFADAAWMGQLDAVFGNLYLDAVRNSVQAPDQVARAWAALLEQRSQTGIAPLQFALAGMNAHINRDLPVAVVTTCQQLSTAPDAGAHHADFERVNTVLAGAEPGIRELVEGQPLAEADQLFPGLQDVVGNFSMVQARETAWVNAQTLWALDQLGGVQGAAYLDGLDHLTGFAGRGLLIRLNRTQSDAVRSAPADFRA
ncbi:MAG: hypothetical protein JO057_12925 [Chloroflexi bacterium]|nr:hypothetical protein [Chloroflexota bacterium]